MSLSPHQRENLNRLVGIPFVKHGTCLERHGGLDCYGIVRAAATIFGVTLPEDPAACFAMRPCPFVQVSNLGQDWREGDVIALDRTPQHLGIVVEASGGFGRVLHTVAGQHQKSQLMDIAAFTSPRMAKAWKVYRKKEGPTG